MLHLTLWSLVGSLHSRARDMTDPMLLTHKEPGSQRSVHEKNRTFEGIKHLSQPQPCTYLSVVAISLQMETPSKGY